MCVCVCVRKGEPIRHGNNKERTIQRERERRWMRDPSFLVYPFFSFGGSWNWPSFQDD